MVNNFFYVCKIVGVDYCFDIEFMVVFFVGFIIFENYIGCYGIGILDVWVVEVFNVNG